MPLPALASAAPCAALGLPRARSLAAPFHDLSSPLLAALPSARSTKDKIIARTLKGRMD